ncbi:MAG: hypothetical protein EAY75_03955 [Bacteroidetes bacterium]|nr:MAG: hypothetical protein EAY75_03955 [Bacteroidota bacterium]
MKTTIALSALLFGLLAVWGFSNYQQQQKAGNLNQLYSDDGAPPPPTVSVSDRTIDVEDFSRGEIKSAARAAQRVAPDGHKNVEPTEAATATAKAANLANGHDALAQASTPPEEAALAVEVGKPAVENATNTAAASPLTDTATVVVDSPANKLEAPLKKINSGKKINLKSFSRGPLVRRDTLELD